MTWIDFLLRLGVALLLGAVIGIERQWRQTKAVLKTNVLVCMGSSMFVMMSVMTPGDSSPTRMAAQVVSGIGFLGGGIILRDGASIKGLNTAATLWCAAAIGTLSGGGFLFQAYLGSAAVVFANLVLRPLVEQIKFQPPTKTQLNPHYSCQIVCDREDEMKVRDLLTHLLNEREIAIDRLKSQVIDSEGQPDRTALEIEIVMSNRGEKFLEEIARKLKFESKNNEFSWEMISKIQDLDKED
jgi:putative Mg2+ transporter-C (MgtC) family protein